VTRMRTVRDKAAVAVLDGQDDVGEIYLTRQRREPIPTGWALDTNGAPITDPQAAIDGLILPMAHHKGYAIAALMDVLSEMFSIPGEAALNRRQADS